MLPIYKIISNINFQKEVPNEKEINEVKKKPYAMYVNNGDGNYTEYKSKDVFPKGYELNKEKSSCEDGSGKKLDEIKEKITQDGNKITVKSNKTVYCTLYFDRSSEIDDIKFYIKEEKSEKYTNEKENRVYVEYTTEGRIYPILYK